MALYDPDHKFTPAPAETKTFDPHAFAAFVRAKPADEAYESCRIRTCALAQFGFSGVTNANEHGIPGDVYKASILPMLGRNGKYSDPTFGALSERLAKLGY